MRDANTMLTAVELMVRPTPTGFLVVTIGNTRWRYWSRQGDLLDQFAVLNLAREIAATGRRLKLEIISDGVPATKGDVTWSRDQFYNGHAVRG